MNIGILFPRSNVYPHIGTDFMEGLKGAIGLETVASEVNIIAESVGFGGSEKDVYAKAEKLLMIDDVDILVGFIDEKILTLLKPLITASSKLLLVVNAGANHPINWIPQENIINLCLHHSLLCAVNGSEAANSGEVNKTGIVASTFYDCGYLHLSAMVREFQAGGGIIVYNYINNQLPSEEFNIDQLAGFLAAGKNDNTLLCIFDSKPAAQFYNLVNKLPGAEALQVFASPMMLEKNALASLPEAGYNFTIHGFLPWHDEIPGDSNKQFVDYFRQERKKEPGIFSLLGWETGLVIKLIRSAGETDYRNGSNIAEKLKQLQISSPRGTLQLDPETNYFLASAIRFTLRAGKSKPDLEFAVDLQNQWEEFIEDEIEGHISGWTNTYLCY